MLSSARLGTEDGMSVFSHSRLSSYETCPLQYRLRYVDELQIDRRETI
jgi:hypothetical protein